MIDKRIVLAVWLPLMLPIPVGAAEPHPEMNDGEERIALGNDVIVTWNTQPRRRRQRPKRRVGKYETIEVHNGGTIEGIVVYHSDIPRPETIQIVKDHQTCEKRHKLRPRIKVNDQKRVADVVVFLGDIKAGKAIPVPSEKPTLKQKHCTFVPHVQVLLKGQPFDLVNSDPVAHNAQAVQRMVTLFNPMQPRQGMRSEFTIKRPGLASITCAVHNWMKAYVYVLWHPYYTVTGDDGSFTLTDVPPGEYELVAWQEHLGERSVTVTAEPGKTTNVEFDLRKE